MAILFLVAPFVLLHIPPQELIDCFYFEVGNLGVSDRYIDAFCGRTPKSLLSSYYTDYNLDRLMKIYNYADLKVLSTKKDLGAVAGI